MSLKLFRRGVGVDGGGGVRYLLIAFSLSCFLSFFSQAVDKLTCVTFLIKMHQGQETHIRKGRVFLSLGEESPHHMKLKRLCHVFLSNAPVMHVYESKIDYLARNSGSPLKEGHELLQPGLRYGDSRGCGRLLLTCLNPCLLTWCLFTSLFTTVPPPPL